MPSKPQETPGSKRDWVATITDYDLDRREKRAELKDKHRIQLIDFDKETRQRLAMYRTDFDQWLRESNSRDATDDKT